MDSSRDSTLGTFSGFLPRETSLFTASRESTMKPWDIDAGQNMGAMVVRRAAWKNLGDNISKRLWFLDGEELSAKARRHTGIEDFGDPPIADPLRILTESLEQEAELHPLGRFLMRLHLESVLETRLRLNEEWRKNPQLIEHPIRQPIFVTGMPRSGSTFLHELLAEDPANRAPRVWEVMFPLPIRKKGIIQTGRNSRHKEAPFFVSADSRDQLEPPYVGCQKN